MEHGILCINATNILGSICMRPYLWLLNSMILYQNELNASLGAARHEADTDSRDVFASIKP